MIPRPEMILASDTAEKQNGVDSKKVYGSIHFLVILVEG